MVVSSSPIWIDRILKKLLSSIAYMYTVTHKLNSLNIIPSRPSSGPTAGTCTAASGFLITAMLKFSYCDYKILIKNLPTLIEWAIKSTKKLRTWCTHYLHCSLRRRRPRS